MTREEVIKQIKENKLIIIVRGVYGEDCVKLAEALYKGGIRLMEITFDQSRPEDNRLTAEAITAVKEKTAGKMLVGAGTVTSLELLKIAKDAGAQFIISPDSNEEVIRKTVDYGLVSIPGAFTPTEIAAAYRWGADFVKLFPAANLGPAYLKAVRAPLNQVPIMAVGGVSEKDIKDFLDAGACGAGVGGNLVNKEWIKNGEFDKITALAKEFIKNVQ